MHEEEEEGAREVICIINNIFTFNFNLNPRFGEEEEEEEERLCWKTGKTVKKNTQIRDY